MVLLDNLSNASPRTLAAIDAVAGRPVPFVRGDIRDAAALDALFTAHRIDAVVHLAADKSVAAPGEAPPPHDAVNTAGTVLLTERMAAHGIKTLVFSSTAAVYGDATAGPIAEDAPTAPASAYARSKLAAERILAGLHRTDPQWRISILRYFNATGAHPGGGLGEDPTNAPLALLPGARAGRRGRRAPPDGPRPRLPHPRRHGPSATTFTSPTSPGPISRRSRGSGARRGFAHHNLGTGRGHTVLDVLRAFERASGMAIPYRLGDRRQGDPAVSRANPARARAELRWRARRSLDVACADFWRWRCRVSRPVLVPARRRPL